MNHPVTKHDIIFLSLAILFTLGFFFIDGSITGSAIKQTTNLTIHPVLTLSVFLMVLGVTLLTTKNNLLNRFK